MSHTVTEKRNVGLRLPPDLWTWIKTEAEANDRSYNKQVIRLLRVAYEREQKQARR